MKRLLLVLGFVAMLLVGCSEKNDTWCFVIRPVREGSILSIERTSGDPRNLVVFIADYIAAKEERLEIHDYRTESQQLGPVYVLNIGRYKKPNVRQVLIGAHKIEIQDDLFLVDGVKYSSGATVRITTANQALVPTPASVTPAADAPVAPDADAAHL
jgi:hypothetical protein